MVLRALYFHGKDSFEQTVKGILVAAIFFCKIYFFVFNRFDFDTKNCFKDKRFREKITVLKSDLRMPQDENFSNDRCGTLLRVLGVMP